MSNEELVKYEKVCRVLTTCGVEIHWLFRQAYLYTETPEERWILVWKVKDFIEKGKVPDPVDLICDRIIADCPTLFKGEGR
jgi:hypothetical protein